MTPIKLSKKLLLKCAFSIVFVLSALLVFQLHQILQDSGHMASSTPPPITAEESQLREYWKAEIKKSPADAAYSAFIESYSEQDENRWHRAMHIFASLLYEQYGIDSLQYCDDSFQNACYHELASSYAFEGELTSTDEILEFCDLDWNCLHGIGHGLVMNQGYDRKDLTGILSLCPSAPMTFIEGCESGVFMEFITRTMGIPRGQSKKFVDTIDRSLCQEVELKYRAPCHFVMVEWIIAQTDHTQTEIVDFIGEYCLSHATGHEDACYKGAGFDIKFLVEEQDEPEGGIALCESISGGHKEYADTCLITLAMQYRSFDKNDHSLVICESVSTEKKEKCLNPIL